MKNIFKYLFLLGIAGLFAVSCKTVPPDNSHVDPAKDAAENPIPGLTIAVSVTADDAATVTVTADGPAAYITILVDANDEDESAHIDPETLYACGYEAVACKTFKYDSEHPASLPLTGLDPNTTYQVYAVTASTTGVVGEVANGHFLTTDHEIPVADIENFETLGNLLAIEFNDGVAYDESKPATAQYYAYNRIRTNASGEIINSGLVGDAHVDVEVEDGVAIFVVTLDGENPLPDGACYTISYPAGAFADAVGNLCEAFNSAPGLDDQGKWAPVNADWTEESDLPENGLGGRLATKAFDLVDDDADATATLPTTASFTFSAPEGVTFAGAVKAAAASFKFVHKEGKAVSSTVYELTYSQDWIVIAAAGQGILMNPTTAIAAPGDQLSYTVAAGSIQDIYGNANAALSHDYVITYGYTVDDVIGTYEVDGTSRWASYNEAPWTFTIEASDDEEEGNVMITEFYSTPLDEPVYCDFDPDLGILTAPVSFPITAFLSGTYYVEYYAITYGVFYYLNGWASAPSYTKLELQMPVSGTFDAINDQWGYYYNVFAAPENPEDMADWTDADWDAAYVGGDYNFFVTVPTSKVAASPDPDPDPAPAPVKRIFKSRTRTNFQFKAPEHLQITRVRK